jgi:hypothetical protein
MASKEKILDEIRRTAQDNGGIPLGRERFERETGIRPYDWGKYWAKFGDAQREAGLAPNILQAAFDDEFVLEKLIAFMREIKRFPTIGDLRVKRNSDPEFPSPKTMLKFGNKRDAIIKLSEYATKQGYDDILEMCSDASKKIEMKKGGDVEIKNEMLGEVYLFKSGRYFKIGKTNDTVRRGNELRIQLPEKMDLIHSIATDDPSGVEAYWHRRFESKRMNGEWFDLSPSDIKAFKRWRKIY